MSDSSKSIRTLLKATTWESISLVLTILIAYWFLGNWSTSVEFAAVCFGVKIFFFFLHDKMWHKISWGRR